MCAPSTPLVQPQPDQLRDTTNHRSVDEVMLTNLVTLVKHAFLHFLLTLLLLLSWFLLTLSLVFVLALALARSRILRDLRPSRRRPLSRCGSAVDPLQCAKNAHAHVVMMTMNEPKCNSRESGTTPRR